MKKSQKQSEAQKLLLEYRPTVWRKAALESTTVIGNNALQACEDQIRFTHEIVNALRSNKLLGEKLYWIIYISYMTDREPHNIEEILSGIAQKHEYIPRRTYFRLKSRAIKMMDGFHKFTEKDCQAG
jgi:hypothetical protein